MSVVLTLKVPRSDCTRQITVWTGKGNSGSDGDGWVKHTQRTGEASTVSSLPWRFGNDRLTVAFSNCARIRLIETSQCGQWATPLTLLGCSTNNHTVTLFKRGTEPKMHHGI